MKCAGSQRPGLCCGVPQLQSGSTEGLSSSLRGLELGSLFYREGFGHGSHDLIPRYMPCTRRSPGSGLGTPALHPQRSVASVTEGSKARGQGGCVIWHTRDNLAPEWSAMYKISMANLRMVKKRKLQDKNMIFCLPSGEASTAATQTAELAVKYPRIKKKKKKKTKYEKNAECFFICKALRVRTKSTQFGVLSLTLIHRKAGENLRSN